MSYADRVFFLPRSIPAHNWLTVENIMPSSSSSQQHGIFPSWNSGRWIPQQSEEEVMTQVGVIAQLAVEPTADDPSFTCFSYLSTYWQKWVFHSQQEWIRAKTHIKFRSTYVVVNRWWLNRDVRLEVIQRKQQPVSVSLTVSSTEPHFL